MTSYSTSSFGLDIFTEIDGIFSSPSSGETIPSDVPYKVTWNASLLQHYQRKMAGGFLGKRARATRVMFEVVCETVDAQGLVLNSISQQQTSNGQMIYNNTGEALVVFPSNMTQIATRFYLTVHDFDNSHVYGWSKGYFFLSSSSSQEPVLPPPLSPPAPMHEPQPDQSSRSFTGPMLRVKQDLKNGASGNIEEKMMRHLLDRRSSAGKSQSVEMTNRGQSLLHSEEPGDKTETKDSFDGQSKAVSELSTREVHTTATATCTGHLVTPILKIGGYVNSVNIVLVRTFPYNWANPGLGGMGTINAPGGYCYTPATSTPSSAPTWAPSESPTIKPAMACTTSWLGDGYCDDVNNNALCNYDNGDCCSSTCVSTAAYACGINGYSCLDPRSVRPTSLPTVLTSRPTYVPTGKPSVSMYPTTTAAPSYSNTCLHSYGGIDCQYYVSTWGFTCSTITYYLGYDCSGCRCPVEPSCVSPTSCTTSGKQHTGSLVFQEFSDRHCTGQGTTLAAYTQSLGGCIQNDAYTGYVLSLNSTANTLLYDYYNSTNCIAHTFIGKGIYVNLQNCSAITWTGDSPMLSYWYSYSQATPGMIAQHFSTSDPF